MMKIDLRLQKIYDLLADLSAVIKECTGQQIDDGEVFSALAEMEKEVKREQEKFKKILRTNVDDYRVIDFLNRALTVEYKAIFDYQIYAAALNDQYLKEKLSRFGLMEIEHARLLAGKITSLGGMALFNPPGFRKTKTLTLAEMLEEHREGERKAITLFEEGLKRINEPELNWFIGKLRLDELEHLREIEELLKEDKDLRAIITVSQAIKWRDDYAGDDQERPWIDG